MNFEISRNDVTRDTDAADVADVTRLIVAYNSAAMLRWHTKTSAALPTVVVDNASTDGSGDVAARIGHKVLRLPANEGFGRGVMAGLAEVGTELALITNPDAAIEEEGIAALVRAARDFPDCDLFLPQITDVRGHVFFRHESSIEPRVRDRMPPSGTACIPMISGAVMLVRVAPFLQFGGFDPGIFLYFEDDDLALRYRRARRPLIYVPAANATHLGDRSSSAEARAQTVKDVSFGWGLAYLMRKHDLASPRLRLAAMVAKLMIYALAGRRQRLQRQWGRIRGFRLGLRGAPAPYLPEGDR